MKQYRPLSLCADSSITVMLPVTVLENVTLDEEAILAVLAKALLSHDPR